MLFKDIFVLLILGFSYLRFLRRFRKGLCKTDELNSKELSCLTISLQMGS